MASFFLLSRSSKGQSFTSTHTEAGLHTLTHTPLANRLGKEPIKFLAPPRPQKHLSLSWETPGPPQQARDRGPQRVQPCSPLPPTPTVCPALPSRSFWALWEGLALPTEEARPTGVGAANALGRGGGGLLLVGGELLSPCCLLASSPASQPRECGQRGGRARELWGLAGLSSSPHPPMGPSSRAGGNGNWFNNFGKHWAAF